jgi:hypothetical protein
MTTDTQARDSSDEHDSAPRYDAQKLWEDLLSTIGTALRDAERLKDRIANDIDLERIRSAFNCQAPGAETLSAEQIVIEHAVEEFKSRLSCGAPTDLDSQEEIIPDTRVAEQLEEESGGLIVTFQPGQPFGISFNRHTGYVESLKEGGLGEQQGIRTGMRLDKIDRSPYTATLFAEKEAGTKGYSVTFVWEDSAATQEYPAVERIAAEPKSETAAVDLLDMTDNPVAEAPVDLLDVAVNAPMDTQEAAETANLIEAASEKAPMDLLDLSDSGTCPVKVEVAAVEVPDLMDLSDALLAPEVNVLTSAAAVQGQSPGCMAEINGDPAPAQAVHELADLLDFSDQLRKTSAPDGPP